MKKTFSFLLTLILLFALFPFQGIAQGQGFFHDLFQKIEEKNNNTFVEIEDTTPPLEDTSFYYQKDLFFQQIWDVYTKGEAFSAYLEKALSSINQSSLFTPFNPVFTPNGYEEDFNAFTYSLPFSNQGELIIEGQDGALYPSLLFTTPTQSLDPLIKEAVQGFYEVFSPQEEVFSQAEKLFTQKYPVKDTQSYTIYCNQMDIGENTYFYLSTYDKNKLDTPYQQGYFICPQSHKARCYTLMQIKYFTPSLSQEGVK